MHTNVKEEEIYSHGNNGERERQTKSGLGFTVFYISLLCSCVYIYLEIFLVDVLTTHNRLPNGICAGAKKQSRNNVSAAGQLERRD